MDYFESGITPSFDVPFGCNKSNRSMSIRSQFETLRPGKMKDESISRLNLICFYGFACRRAAPSIDRPFDRGAMWHRSY
jgi:hypothetical protein